MKKITISILLLLSLLTQGRATNYYFSSVNGDDSRTALQAQNQATPWASYNKLNTIFSTLNPGDSALFRRGETFYTITTLTISKSGTNGASINIGAYGPGSRPIITSLLNLTWSNVTGNLWRSNEQLGLNSLTLVTVNNSPQEMGRWPNRSNGNNGYNTVANSTTNTLAQTTGSELTGQPGIHPGAQVVYRPEKFWIERERITGYNSTTKVITFALGSGEKAPQKGFGYFVQNDSLMMDQQNEWWYNRATKKLKIYSIGSPSNVAAATVKTFIYSTGKSYININDLNFNGCDSDAVRTTGGAKFKVENCIIQNVGRNGIKTGTHDFSILSDSVVNSLSKGIVIADGNRAIIRYNTVRNTGQLIGHNTSNIEDGHGSHSGVGIYVVSGGDNTIIEYNHVINSGHNGIHLRKFDSAIVRYNYVDSVDNVLDDGGGIYTYIGAFNRDARGRKIIGNIVLNGIGAPEGGSGNFAAGAGVAGLYFDRGSNDIEADSNFVAYFGQGTLINFGSNHLKVRHNTFYSNTLDGIQINTRKASNDTTRSLEVTYNTVIARLTTQKTLVTFTNDGDYLNRFGTIDHNIYARPLDDNLTMTYQSGTLYKVSLPTWRTKFPMYDANSKRSLFDYTSLAQQSDSTNFYFNNSFENAIVYVADTSQDMRGNTYAGSTSLAPGQALFLFTTGSSAAVVVPPDPPDPPLPRSSSNILYTRLKLRIL